MTWFRINIGRDRNADPRWLLPLICRAGGVTKSEIGAIRVDDRETRFQIVTTVADQFDHAARTAKKKEGQIVRVGQDADAVAGEIAAPSKTTPAAVPPVGERTERKPEMKKDKSRWRTRGKGKGEAGGWAPRRRDGTKPGPHGGQAAVDHGKPADKRAKKKKHRPPAPAAE